MQKTAYEVRISDWSSDVCSSDLRLSALPCPLGRVDTSCRQTAQAYLAEGRFCLYPGHPSGSGVTVATRRDALLGAGGNPHTLADRKSVVSGKSVSVRVGLGGRRIIKNKI